MLACYNKYRLHGCLLGDIHALVLYILVILLEDLLFSSKKLE